jgi:tripartite-type tricarboxylate transporter receptor subunit TctC
MKALIHRTAAILTGTLLAAAPALAQAQAAASWPARPVVFVIPVAPGSNTELEPRMYANKMSEALGKPFILDFKPGAANVVGSRYVAQSAGDGHTLLVANANFPLMQFLVKDAPDPVKAFAPVSLMSKRSTLFVISNSAPFSGIKEYIAFGKANPGKINFGVSGLGSTQHLHAVWMHSMMGFEPAYIAYKGVGAMLPDLMAGRVDVGIASIAASMGQVKAGKIRILAYGAKERSPAVPDVPTIAEQGLPEFEYLSWLGMVAPASTPPALVTRISSELVKAARQPDVIAQLAKEANTVVASTPQEFQRQIDSEVERWKALVQKTGFRFGSN